jgi:hypothetical protein
MRHREEEMSLTKVVPFLVVSLGTGYGAAMPSNASKKTSTRSSTRVAMDRCGISPKMSAGVADRDDVLPAGHILRAGEFSGLKNSARTAAALTAIATMKRIGYRSGYGLRSQSQNRI